MRLYNIFKITEILIFLGLLSADMYYLIGYWDTTCDEPLQIWLSLNLVIWVVVIFTGLIPVNKREIHFVNFIHFVAFVSYIGDIIFGYYLFFDTNDCKSTVPAIYNLLLGHVIIETIDSLVLLIIMVRSLYQIYQRFTKKGYTKIVSYNIESDRAELRV